MIITVLKIILRMRQKKLESKTEILRMNYFDLF